MGGDQYISGGLISPYGPMAKTRGWWLQLEFSVFNGQLGTWCLEENSTIMEDRNTEWNEISSYHLHKNQEICTTRGQQPARSTRLGRAITTVVQYVRSTITPQCEPHPLRQAYFRLHPLPQVPPYQSLVIERFVRERRDGDFDETKRGPHIGFCLH